MEKKAYLTNANSLRRTMDLHLEKEMVASYDLNTMRCSSTLCILVSRDLIRNSEVFQPQESYMSLLFFFFSLLLVRLKVVIEYVIFNLHKTFNILSFTHLFSRNKRFIFMRAFFSKMVSKQICSTILYSFLYV